MWQCTEIDKYQAWFKQQKHYLEHLEERHHLKKIDSGQFLKKSAFRFRLALRQLALRGL